jgi:hypothetical protein
VAAPSIVGSVAKIPAMIPAQPRATTCSTLRSFKTGRSAGGSQVNPRMFRVRRKHLMEISIAVLMVLTAVEVR